MNTFELCACGQRLHYQDPANYAKVAALVRELGSDLPVTVGRRTWMVPRHFIALHGLRAADLPELALIYGFTEV